MESGRTFFRGRAAVTLPELAVIVFTAAVVIFTVCAHISRAGDGGEDIPVVMDEALPAWAEPSGEAAPLININTADAGQLMRLDGIGEKLAGRIIEYRQENGGFDAVEDIMEVPGIGQGIFDRIRGQITVG